ncbi:MAG: sodium:solute symporter family protein [Rhodothermales bacterium]|nr:sodium:solute symporter family protein [Rhodothermales bacterium]
MALSLLDWLLIAAYFVFSFGIAIYYYRRAGKNTSEFFLSGRHMPWWLAGTSMVATTFAADTPLAVTELVAQNGIAGNWLWWNMAFGAMLTVFFFARLWRRSGILTDVEFVEMRYAGRAAAWLRGIKAVYFGLLMNCIIIGWVSLAMETVIEVLFPGLTIFGQASFSVVGFEFSAALVLVSGLVLVVAVYSLLSGLWGITVTDAFQFVIAITGSVLLAVYVLDVPEVGGIAGLQAQLPESTFRMLPTLGEAAEGAAVLALTVPAFIAYIGVQWWSSWYPGAEPGGGGYVAQRMMSAKDEKNALFATLWFTIAHYCLRPWPWILVALASLVLYPDLTDAREGFVLAMRDVLPSGLLGLLVAAFLAAFMSTISTQLNWGVSYLVNDLWRRFVKTDGDERYYVAVSRLFTFLVALLSLFVTARLESISGAWGLILTASAGLGLVLILRWYWWRLNAWSELTATLAPIVMVALVLAGVPIPGLDAPFPTNLFAVVLITTVLWVAATFLTRPTDAARLDAFYRTVRPGGPGWKPVQARLPHVVPDTGLGRLALQWAAGVVLVYATLFGSGYLLFGRTAAGLGCLVLAALAAAFLWWDLSRSTAPAVFTPAPEPPPHA